MKYLIVAFDYVRLWFGLPALYVGRSSTLIYGVNLAIFAVANLLWALSHNSIGIVVLGLIEFLVYLSMPRVLGERLAAIATVACVLSLVLSLEPYAKSLAMWQWIAVSIELARYFLNKSKVKS